MLIEAGCEGSTVAQCHLPSQNPAGTQSRAAFYAKSAYVNRPMPSAGLSAVVDQVAALVTDLPAEGGGMVFDAAGKPWPPEVCVDFVRDSFERTAGTWFTPRGLPLRRDRGLCQQGMPGVRRPADAGRGRQARHAAAAGRQ